MVRVTAAPWDRDDAVLSNVQLLRNGASVWSASNVTAPWWQTTVAYTDRNVTSGTKYTYQLKMTDADGNTVYSGTASAVPSGTALADSTYSRQVMADGPRTTGAWTTRRPAPR